MKKRLVVFYSRTGNTKKVGMEIARVLKADHSEILDKKKRSGIVGWIFGGRDSMMGNTTKISKTGNKNPEKYEEIIIGTPIWAFTMTPAVKTYLLENDAALKKKKLAFFCTCGGGGIDKTFHDMKNLSKNPVAKLSIVVKGWDAKIKMNSGVKEKIKEFCDKLKTK